MKLGIMVGTPELTQRWCVFLDGADLESNIKKAALWGYSGIELAVRDPSLLNAQDIRRWLVESDLQLIGICSGEVFGSDGLGLVGIHSRKTEAAYKRMMSVVDFAGEFGEDVLVNIGRVRGRLDPDHRRESYAAAVSVFQELADNAAQKKARLALEPINHYEVNYILTTQDGIAFADAVGKSNFGLMLDTYHMNIEDQDMCASLRDAERYLWHIHIADNNRKWPGNAHIDFEEIARTLKTMGYNGYLSVEALPWPDPETAGRQTHRFMQAILNKL